MKIPSYTRVLNLGHRYTDPIVDGREVRIEEKFDGSQFSAMVSNGELYYRSRNTQIFKETVGKLFKKAVDWFENNKSSLLENCIYRCEAICSPRHNHLKYDRAPDCGFVLWDIEEIESGDVFASVYRKTVCDDLGINYVPPWYIGIPQEPIVDFYRSFLNQESLLGGTIEGIVIKPIDFVMVPETAKRLAVKLVREEYREAQGASFKKANPGAKDIIETIGAQFANDARFRKAVQHLDEGGVLLREPKDIGPLLQELQKDLLEEYTDEIKDSLFKWAIKHIQRRATKGFPEWYKNWLIERLDGSTEKTHTG